MHQTMQVRQLEADTEALSKISFVGKTQASSLLFIIIIIFY